MMKFAFAFLVLLSLYGCSTAESVPVTFDNRQQSPRLSLIAGSHGSMVVTEDGELWAWGHFYGGDEWCQWCGTGHTEVLEYPVKIMDDVSTVSAGGTHTMAIKTDGSLWGWGTILGDIWDIPERGTIIDRHYPVKILDDVVAVSVGWTHTLAIRDDGGLWAWGNNSSGQLGDGTTMTRHSPIRIMDDVVAISAGGEYSLAVKADGSLWSWGTNLHGQLGDGGTDDRHYPANVMNNVAAVYAQGGHPMAIGTDGSLWTWGSYLVQFGYELEMLSPTRIMDDVAAVSAGGTHTMAIKTDGSLWGWGSNKWGQIGDGCEFSFSEMVRYFDEPTGGIDEGLLNRPVPIKIIDDVYSISTGWNHSLAIRNDGTMLAWGGNHAGQLGDGTLLNSSTPRVITALDWM